MKKIAIILAALLTAFSSCNKETNIAQPEKQAIKLNITVSDPMVGTRAVKTGWATGDKIYVWLEGNQVAKRPDFTLTYGSGGWTASELREGASLADGNKLAAVYSSYNDLSVLAASSFNLVVPHETIGSVTAYAAPL